MAELIQVTARKQDSRVIVWERQTLHPEGECFVVADGRTYTVAPTSRILRLLEDGVLLQVKAAPETGTQTPASEQSAPVEEQPADEPKPVKRMRK